MSSAPITASPPQRAATPSAFPAPGSFGVTQRITLSAFAITPTATSSRHQSLTIDGAAHPSGAPHWVQLGDGQPLVTIAVTSPDGTVAQTYTLAVSRAAR